MYWLSKLNYKRYSDVDFTMYDAEKIMLLDALERLKKPVAKIKILDLGCGGGRTTIPLYKMGFQVIGVDISKELIEFLRKKIGRRAILADVVKYKFPHERFDIIIFSHNSLDCIYPKQDRTKVLKKINLALKKNGFFIFSSHIYNPYIYSFNGLYTWIRNFTQTLSILKGNYFIEDIDGVPVRLYGSYSKKTIETELKKTGFKLLRHTNIIHIVESSLRSYLRSIISWERYYLAQRNH